MNSTNSLPSSSGTPGVGVGVPLSNGPSTITAPVALPISADGSAATVSAAVVQPSGSGGIGTLPPESQILDRKRLQELVKEVDPSEQLDEEVEDLLLHIADDFIEQTVAASCALAKHRKANTVDVRDVQLVLERSFNMWVPGFGTEDIKCHRRSAMTEAHRARMALIRKTLKKY